eukprot:1875804-Karenia_brevis.AAC.1
MAVAGAPQTLADLYEAEPDTAIPFDQVIRIVYSLTCQKLPTLDQAEVGLRAITPAALTLKYVPAAIGRGRRPGSDE